MTRAGRDGTIMNCLMSAPCLTGTMQLPLSPSYYSFGIIYILLYTIMSYDYIYYINYLHACILYTRHLNYVPACIAQLRGVYSEHK